MSKIPYVNSFPKLSGPAEICLKLDDEFLRAIIAGKRPLHWGIVC